MTDYIIREAMKFLDVIQKKSYNTLYNNYSVGRNKVSSLGNWVYYHHYIKFSRLREFYNKVYTNGLLSCIWHRQQVVTF